MNHSTLSTQLPLGEGGAVPTLSRWEGSWVVSRRSTGAVVSELFDAKDVAGIDRRTFTIETIGQYLGRINQLIACGQVLPAAEAPKSKAGHP